MTYGNFQWPFDDQVKFMLWITMGVRGSSPGKFEKRLSKWCKSRHIWHIFVNVFHLTRPEYFGFSRLDILSHRRQQCPGGALDRRIHGYKGYLGRPSDAIKCRNKFIRKNPTLGGRPAGAPECRRPPALRGQRGPPLRQCLH